MSDEQKALVSLALALNSADASLAQLNHPAHDSAPLPVVRADLLSLLALLQSSVTKISIALKPAKPTYSAALTPLKDTADHLAAIAHCVSLLHPRDGVSLRNEFIAIARDLLSATASLLRAFLPQRPGLPPSDEYLAKTGAIYALIDTARSPDGLSPHNSAAVHKACIKDHSILLDAIEELEQSLQDVSDPDDDDDGWDELGIGRDDPITTVERKRGESLLSILRTTSLVHRRVADEILSSFPSDHPPSTEANSLLDSLVSRSTALINAADELVGTVFSPPAELKQELLSFKTILSDLKSDLDRLQPHLPLHRQLQVLQINGSDNFTVLQQNLDSLLTSLEP